MRFQKTNETLNSKNINVINVQLGEREHEKHINFSGIF